jgi:hypothetical protein
MGGILNHFIQEHIKFMGEKKTMHIIINDNRSFIKELLDDLRNLEKISLQNIYQQDPWYVNSIPLNSLEEISPEKLKNHLGFCFYFDSVVLKFELYNNHLIVDYSSEVHTQVDLTMLPLLKKWFDRASFVIIGYETEVNIKDIDHTIDYYTNTYEMVVLINKGVIELKTYEEVRDKESYCTLIDLLECIKETPHSF